jgi:hypothetical protein
MKTGTPAAAAGSRNAGADFFLSGRVDIQSW